MAGDLHTLLNDWAKQLHKAAVEGASQQELYDLLVSLYDNTATGVLVVRLVDGMVSDAVTDNPFIQGATGFLVVDEEDGEQAIQGMEDGTACPLSTGQVVVGIGHLIQEDLSEEAAVFDTYENSQDDSDDTEFPTSFSPPSVDPE
jgi:hypothetical protein